MTSGGDGGVSTRMVENETLEDGMGNKGVYNGPVLTDAESSRNQRNAVVPCMLMATRPHPSDDPDAPPPALTDISLTDVSLEDDKPPIPHGPYGQMVYINHEKFVKFTGDWSHGKWTRGTLLYANGDVYSGPWNGQGQPHGADGKMEWVVGAKAASGGGGEEDTRTYQGDWKNGLRHGQGTYTWSRTGAIYQGAFDSNQRQGYGTYRDPTTHIEYVGEWKQGVYHGYGQYTWIDSSTNRKNDKCVYRGNFVRGKPHGHGIQVNDEGVVMHDGTWDNGKPIITQINTDQQQEQSQKAVASSSSVPTTTTTRTTPQNKQQQQMQTPATTRSKPAHVTPTPHATTTMRTPRAPPNTTPPLPTSATSTPARVSHRTVTHIPAPGSTGSAVTKIVQSPPPPRGGKRTAAANGSAAKTPSAGDVTVVHDREWTDTFNQAQPALGIYRGLWLHHNPYQNGLVVYQSGEVDSYEGWFNPQGYYHGQGCRLTFRNGDTYEGDFQFGQRHGKGLYTWKDGRQYKGAFFKNARQGKGTLIYPNSDFYEGHFIQGKRHGHGRFIFASGSMYEGTWQGGLYHGQGTLVQSDGSTYVGEFVNGVKHGQGQDMNQMGDVVFEGQYVRGRPKDSAVPDTDDAGSAQSPVNGGTERPGDYQTPQRPQANNLRTPSSSASTSSAVTESYWVEDDGDSVQVGGGAPSSSQSSVQQQQEIEPPCHAVVDQKISDCQGNLGRFTGIVLTSSQRPHGVGRLVYADGKRIHEGFWKNGSKEGHGRCLFFPQGDFHEGEYLNNLRNGPGRYQWKDGRLFMGRYKDDMRHGKGIFTYPSGDKYEGMFFRGQRSGYGRFVFSGGQYEGEWKAGKYHGRGRLVWGPGTEYEGEFSQGTFHGPGTLRDFTGNILEQGRWVQGKRVRLEGPQSTPPRTATTTTNPRTSSLEDATEPCPASPSRPSSSERAPPPASAPPPPPCSAGDTPVLPAQEKQAEQEPPQEASPPFNPPPPIQPPPEAPVAPQDQSQEHEDSARSDAENPEVEPIATTTTSSVAMPPTHKEQHDGDNSSDDDTTKNIDRNNVANEALADHQMGGEDPVENNNNNSSNNNNTPNAGETEDTTSDNRGGVVQDLDATDTNHDINKEDMERNFTSTAVEL